MLAGFAVNEFVCLSPPAIDRHWEIDSLLRLAPIFVPKSQASI
jgi:hypothetical protein